MCLTDRYLLMPHGANTYLIIHVTVWSVLQYQSIKHSETSSSTSINFRPHTKKCTCLAGHTCETSIYFIKQKIIFKNPLYIGFSVRLKWRVGLNILTMLHTIRFFNGLLWIQLTIILKNLAFLLKYPLYVSMFELGIGYFNGSRCIWIIIVVIIHAWIFSPCHHRNFAYTCTIIIVTVGPNIIIIIIICYPLYIVYKGDKVVAS